MTTRCKLCDDYYAKYPLVHTYHGPEHVLGDDVAGASEERIGQQLAMRVEVDEGDVAKRVDPGQRGLEDLLRRRMSEAGFKAGQAVE